MIAIGSVSGGGGGGGGGDTITLGVYSDAGFTTPITESDIGTTIYVKGVPTGFTPIDYLLFYEDVSGVLFPVYGGVNDNSSWLVEGVQGAGRMFAIATDDGDNWIGADIAFELTAAAGLLDAYPNNNVFAASQIVLKSTFTNALIKYRRSSDNAAANFLQDVSVDPSRITADSIATASVPSSHDGNALSVFVAATNAFSPVLYDQTANANDAFQTVSGKQPKVVASGSLLTDSSRPVLEFDGTTQVLDLWALYTTAPTVYQSIGTAISVVMWVKPSILSTGTGAAWFATRTIIELNGGGNAPFSIGFEGTKLKVGVADNSISSWDGFLSTSTIVVNTTYKIIVTIDDNTVKMYINGTLDSTHTIVNSTGDRTIGVASSFGQIGGRADILNFGGKMIIPPVIYAQVFTPAEVTDITNNYLT